MWTCPARVISLLDVKTYMATRLAEISNRLVNAWAWVVDFPKIGEQDKMGFANEVNNIAVGAEEISLPMTARHARRLSKAVHTSGTYEELQSLYDELQNRFNDELESVKFFLVDKARMAYFDNTLLAGEQFKTQFPRSNGELIEAGNCFALDRYTACAFHLMRALEGGLKAVAAGLSLPDPNKGSGRNWGNMLKDIKSKIDSNNAALKTDLQWQAEREFYEKAYAFLEGVRSPLRNSTMHVESDYDEQGAIDVLNACSTFMRHIATKLAE